MIAKQIRKKEFTNFRVSSAGGIRRRGVAFRICLTSDSLLPGSKQIELYAMA